MSNIADTSSAQQTIANRTTGISNATGDGTLVTCVFNNLVQGSGFDLGTGVFTCTVAGTFLFFPYTTASNLNSSATLGVLNLVTTSRTYTFGNLSVGAYRSQALLCSFGGYVIARMDAGDTAISTIQVSNTTKTIGYTASINVVRLF